MILSSSKNERNEEKLIQLTSERLIIRHTSLDDVDSMVQYRIENRNHLEPIEPQRPIDFYTSDYWKKSITAQLDACKNDCGYSFVIFEKNNPTKICGVINLSNVVRLAFQACYLGYSLGKEFEGRGYMHEALSEVIRYAFDEINIHRIMANYILSNQRSENVLQKHGFIQEGIAKNYLRINGKWEDHVLTSLTNQSWKE